ncbi:hypothetical protein [Pseudoduganella violaceinigra]|uniref:hypothetical protein n=1 Tax=Pseudoduganella violaceinigra TaxID=246602 RepID=UPI0012B64B6A|nr:hypothetical protein [Pseudoduganella violaceinigra]
MKKPGKALALALGVGLLVLLVLLAAGGAWYQQRLTERGSLPCAQQPPAQLSPYCLAQSQAAAGRGDRAAMAALVAYFDLHQPAQALRWVRAAAKLGDPLAISRVLAACGEGKPFSVDEARALLPQAGALASLNFRLGGSCSPADMDAARNFAPASLMAAPDGAGLCAVAVRYGLLRLSPDGAQLDSPAAQLLLAECERRQQVAPGLRKEAESVRQMLAREIRPVRISVD